MAKHRFFSNYIKNEFEDELFKEIEEYITKNYSYLDLRLQRVRNIGRVEMIDILVKFVNVNDLPDMKIEFDVVIDAEFEAYETECHYDKSETCRTWVTVKCSGDLAKDLEDFKILDISAYIGKNKRQNPMSDSLVPIMKKDQLEDVASDFLRKHYPEALLAPMAIQPHALAKKMGLVLEVREITKDCTIFGQICFRSCKAGI